MDMPRLTGRPRTHLYSVVPCARLTCTPKDALHRTARDLVRSHDHSTFGHGMEIAMAQSNIPESCLTRQMAFKAGKERGPFACMDIC